MSIVSMHLRRMPLRFHDSRAWLHLKVACCAGYRAVDTMVWGD